MHLRVRPLDGALLGFDPRTGLSVRVRGPETRALRAVAPRAVQIAVTNHCNLACGFCYRDQSAESAWTVDALVELLRDLDRAGVLEVAFGGGEPFAFKGLTELLDRLRETQLAVSITTNGELVDAGTLARIRGCYAELRLSLYDGYERIVDRFVAAGARFGVNLLVTPQRLPRLASIILDLAARGVTDILLLSYNGDDASLHLSAAQMTTLEGVLNALRRGLGERCALKLSVCFGERLENVPRVFRDGDCGAGSDFIAIGSDRTMRACSFHHESVEVRSASDVLSAFRDRPAMAGPARIKGCARWSNHGLDGLLRLRRSRNEPSEQRTEVHLYRAYASNNSGSYTLVGYVPGRELAAATAAELTRMCAEQTEWLEANPEERYSPKLTSPLDLFVERLGLTLGDDRGRGDAWPESGTIEVTSIGSQVLLHVDCTITMPQVLGEVFYKRGGGVRVEHDHSHDPLVVVGSVWSDRVRQLRNEPLEPLFVGVLDELRALLPTLAAKSGHSEERVEPAWFKADAPISFAIVFEELVSGVRIVNELVERHGASLSVDVLEPPVRSADPLAAWRASAER